MSFYFWFICGAFNFFSLLAQGAEMPCVGTRQQSRFSGHGWWRGGGMFWAIWQAPNGRIADHCVNSLPFHYNRSFLGLHRWFSWEAGDGNDEAETEAKQDMKEEVKQERADWGNMGEHRCLWLASFGLVGLCVPLFLDMIGKADKHLNHVLWPRKSRRLWKPSNGSLRWTMSSCVFFQLDKGVKRLICDNQIWWIWWLERSWHLTQAFLEMLCSTGFLFWFEGAVSISLNDRFWLEDCFCKNGMDGMESCNSWPLFV